MTDRQRGLIYGGLGAIALMVAGADELFETGLGTVAWIAVLVGGGWLIFNTWRAQNAPRLVRRPLKRTLGSFQVFAISFAFISVAVGIFGTYDEVLPTAGPVGIWLWVIVAVGQTLVALVIAQFAARISLTGSSYQWASRLPTRRSAGGSAG